MDDDYIQMVAYSAQSRLNNTHPVECVYCGHVVLAGRARKRMMSEDGLDYDWVCPPCYEQNRCDL
jgi:hypothetical protein